MPSIKTTRNELKNYVIKNIRLFDLRSVGAILKKIETGRKTTLDTLKEQFRMQRPKEKLTLKTITQRAKAIENVVNTQRIFIEKGDANGLLNYIVMNKKPLDKSLFNTLFNILLTGAKKNLLITDQNGNVKVMPINANNRQFIENILTRLYTEATTNQVGSDNFDTINLQGVQALQVVIYQNKHNIQKEGAYFKYENTTNIDLSKYQIYQNTQEKSRENCLIHVLRLYDISEQSINEVMKLMVGGLYIKKTSLKYIAEIIKKTIRLYTYNDKRNQQDIVKYGKFDESINVGLFENHFFILEDTIYSKYSVENYDELNEVPNFHHIYKKQSSNPNERKVNSLTLIKLLFQQGKFVTKDQSADIEYKEQDVKDINLSFIAEEQQPCQIKSKLERGQPEIWYADTETYVNTGKHELMMLGVVGENCDNVSILHLDDFTPNVKYTAESLLMFEFLTLITKNGRCDAVVYFHNLKYDFHVLEKNLHLLSKCTKDGAFYSVTCIFKKRRVEIRDSFKLLPFGLSKFCKELSLPQHLHKKEAISYSFYDKSVKNYCNTSIADYKANLAYNLHSVFDENVKPFLTSDKTFDAMKYYIHYLEYDCLVLKHGMNAFDKLICQITDNRICLKDCLTISSLTDKFNYIEDAYENVYEMRGNLRDYTARAIYGGRVFVNPKHQMKIIEGKIADYDGVSLYPSAIVRLCDELGGLPTGEAIRFKTTELSQWATKIFSIMTVKITKVNKRQQMPMIAVKGDIIDYINEAPKDTVTISSICLQDYIKFHQIDYEVLDGIYWNTAVNPKIKSVITKLFDKRVENKVSNPALANTLKLMLNSAYGKTILKKSDTYSIIKSKEQVDNYVFNNFNTIKETVPINDRQTEIVCYNADGSFNRSHIGVAILDMSKRIMNEVFDIANDNNINIYYTDTDSIHMDYDKTPLLEQKYFDRYGRVLNGKRLGQFHNDFSLEGAVGEIYATKSIFLGKKCYIDKIQGKDADGNVVTGTHYRMKGITEDGLKYSAKKDFCGDAFKMYEYLTTGMALNILMNPYDEETNKTKVMFDFVKGHGVTTKTSFYREVCFK